MQIRVGATDDGLFLTLRRVGGFGFSLGVHKTRSELSLLIGQAWDRLAHSLITFWSSGQAVGSKK